MSAPSWRFWYFCAFFWFNLLLWNFQIILVLSLKFYEWVNQIMKFLCRKCVCVFFLWFLRMSNTMANAIQNTTQHFVWRTLIYIYISRINITGSSSCGVSLWMTGWVGLFFQSDASALGSGNFCLKITRFLSQAPVLFCVNFPQKTAWRFLLDTMQAPL